MGCRPVARPRTELPGWRILGTNPAKAAACRAPLNWVMSPNSPGIAAALVSAMPAMLLNSSKPTPQARIAGLDALGHATDDGVPLLGVGRRDHQGAVKRKGNYRVLPIFW